MNDVGWDCTPAPRSVGAEAVVEAPRVVWIGLDHGDVEHPLRLIPPLGVDALRRLVVKLPGEQGAPTVLRGAPNSILTICR